MWTAIGNVCALVSPGGRLFISIYNDQGRRSRWWRVVKRLSVRLPEQLKKPYVVFVMAPRELLSIAASIARGSPLGYVRTWTDYKRRRGMSRWHDLVDWVGGYPFEVAAPHEVFEACRDRGFALQELKTVRDIGCNEFVFARERRDP
jgi:2-polyprenyl-6-hydroxyphenyl methylase/3-demethylubiquinone-9 3-methyltransferase